jgi:hypothetical protein
LPKITFFEDETCALFSSSALFAGVAFLDLVSIPVPTLLLLSVLGCSGNISIWM